MYGQVNKGDKEESKLVSLDSSPASEKIGEEIYMHYNPIEYKIRSYKDKLEWKK